MYCISGINVPAYEGTYNLDNNSGLTERQLLDIGNIINSYDKTYLDKELAIFTYLDKPGKIDNTHIAYKVVEDAKTLTDIYENATLDLSENKLIFNLEDNYYKTQNIIVSSEANIKDISYSVTSSNSNISPTIEKNNDGSFRVLIPKEEVENLFELTTIKLLVSAYKTNPKVTVYYAADTYQKIVKLNKEAKQTITKTIEGNIGTTKLIINKKDKNNNFLVGAKLRVECISKDCNFVTKEIITKQNPYILENIPYGEYKITEIEAPNEYLLSEQILNVTVSSNNLIKEVTIINELKEISVPDTLSSKSAFLLFIAMIDIALGIGLITLMKTKKQ